VKDHNSCATVIFDSSYFLAFLFPFFIFIFLFCLVFIALLFSLLFDLCCLYFFFAPMDFICSLPNLLGRLLLS
jgi:hypothetical protein